MAAPYVVLCSWKPTAWYPKFIGESLCGYTELMGFKPHHDPKHGPIHWKKGWFDERLHAEVRRRTINSPGACDWHQDGDTTPGSRMDCALVTWANTHPTEFLFGGVVYSPRPFEVVVSRNLACQHRRPLDAPRVRWMFRQRVQVPNHIKLP